MTVHRTADIFSRRAALALAGGGAGALLLAACGSGDGTSGVSTRLLLLVPLLKGRVVRAQRLRLAPALRPHRRAPRQTRGR
mgnify:CR=1 FL=1